MKEQFIGLSWFGTTTGVQPQGSPLGRMWRQIMSFARTRGEVVMGAHIATRGLSEAVLTYLPQSMRIYTSNDWISAASKSVESIRKSRVVQPGSISVNSIRNLHSDWEHGNVNAWFEPSGDLITPLKVRAAVRAPAIPIILLHHSISDAQMLHDSFLFLLLGKTYPFDALVCTSRAAKEAMRRTFDHITESVGRSHGLNSGFNGSLPLIPLGVDTDHFCPRNKELARTHFAIRRDRLVLLFLGRLSVVDKGDLLPWLAALTRLSDATRKRLEIVIAGSERPGMVKQLREWASQVGRDLRIRVISPFPETMKNWLYAAADVFISPADNLQEAFGLAPLEAMACGVPQVVSDWDGYRDTVVDGTTGFLIPTLWTACDNEINASSSLGDWARCHFLLAQSVAVDCEAFAKRIELLVENEGLRNRMAQASRERAVEFYSWPQISKQYEELLISLMAAAKDWKNPRESDQAREFPYYIPGYFKMYNHYASRILHGTTRICSSGRSLSRSELTRALPYPNVQELDLAKCRHIAELVNVLGAGGATVNEIVSSSMRTFPGTTSDAALRHLMWLVKYGFLGATVNEEPRTIDLPDTIERPGESLKPEPE